ncbi:MAG TPA: cellulose biosynthesis cyclic di-GMP-binding regulatory protein BcsB [Xanthobacteraceae bacterium]|nr:cellulose biosynthesis cyclic di-GMP-binding regulatory protein BcsB [Xanthobacteraceae bacterium]
MIRAAILASVILLGVPTAQAETRTVSITVKERNFASGFQLRSRESATAFFSLPRPENISNLRLRMAGTSTTPSLYRGSVLVTANGQPVDSFALERADGVLPIQREVVIDVSKVAPNGSMNLRFDAEMLTNADPCTADYDSANVVSILPETTVSFDVDIARIVSLSEAVQLLPRRARIILPGEQGASPEIAQAALQLAVVMLAYGVEPRITTERGNDIAAIRLRSLGSGKAGAVLEREDGKLDIVIDPSHDVVALTRLWQLAPATITGGSANVGRVSAPQHVRADFREFSPLPPAQPVRQKGSWSMNFPLLADDGRATQRALVRIAVAPDWSSLPPIATFYLNDQLVTAQRLNVGDNEVTFALPPQVLNFSNVLRVVVDRAPDRQACTPPQSGHAVQILPGSGVSFGNEPATGFIGFAHRFATGGTVLLPTEASKSDAIGPYLLFTAKMISAFGASAEKTTIAFGSAPSGQADRPSILFEVAGPEGLQLPVPAHSEQLNLASLGNAPLVGLFASNDGSRLRVVMAKPGEVPRPVSLYLRGGGANAIVADSGVVWHDAPPPTRMSLFQDIKNSAQNIEPWLRQYGLIVLFATIALIVLIVLGRRLLMLYFRSR